MGDITAESVKNCSLFRPYHEREYIFFAVNVVIVSVFCVLGMIGNLLNMVIFTRDYYQKQSQSIVYVFLSAMAFADFFVLAFRSPTALSNADVLPYYVNYSVYMAYFHVVQYGLFYICKHSSTWIAVSAAVMFYMTMGKSFRKKDLWVRRNRGRVGVVFVFLFCTMLDMPRFFERKVMNMQSKNCFEGVTVYYWENSDFSKHVFFKKNYPWIVAGACYALPLFIILLFIILVVAKARSASYKRRERERAKRSRRRTPKQACQMLVALLVVVFILELPEAIANVFWALDLPQIYDHIDQQQLELISRAMSLIHASVTFIIYSVISSDFRKTLGNTFCCLCLSLNRRRSGSSKISSSSVSGSRRSSESSSAEGTMPTKKPTMNGTINYYTDIDEVDRMYRGMNGTLPGTLQTIVEDSLPRNGQINKASVTDLSAGNSTPMWI